MKRLAGWNDRLIRNSSRIGIIGMLVVITYNVFQWRRYRKNDLIRTNQRNPPPLDQWPNHPKVSLLVTAWNEADLIEQHIRSYHALRYPQKELIICAGGEDDTFKIASPYRAKDVNIQLQTSGDGKQGALRKCFSESRGEIIYLTDADCMLDDASFESVIYPIACGKEAACSGGSQPFVDSMKIPLVAIQAATDFIQFTNFVKPKYYPGMFGRNSALTRDAVFSIGGFNCEAPTGTDYVLAMELDHQGIRIKQVRNSLIRSEYPHSPHAYLRQKRRWHRNVLFYSSKYGNLREFSMVMLPSLIAIYIFLMPIFFPIIGPISFIFWILLLTHGFLSRRRYLYILCASNNKEYPASTIYILLSIFLDLAGWLLGVIDSLFPTLRAKW